MGRGPATRRLNKDLPRAGVRRKGAKKIENGIYLWQSSGAIDKKTVRKEAGVPGKKQKKGGDQSEKGRI